MALAFSSASDASNGRMSRSPSLAPISFPAPTLPPMETNRRHPEFRYSKWTCCRCCLPQNRIRRMKHPREERCGTDLSRLWPRLFFASAGGGGGAFWRVGGRGGGGGGGGGGG